MGLEPLTLDAIQSAAIEAEARHGRAGSMRDVEVLIFSKIATLSLMHARAISALDTAPQNHDVSVTALLALSAASASLAEYMDKARNQGTQHGLKF